MKGKPKHGAELTDPPQPLLDGGLTCVLTAGELGRGLGFLVAEHSLSQQTP